MYDGLITRPEESCCVSNCICDHRNPERGPMFQVGNERKMNEWMNENINDWVTYIASVQR
jgi:hypothetical protein